MSLKLVSDSTNVVHLPQQRHTAPTIETVRETAPALVASIRGGLGNLDNRIGGISA